MARLAVILGVAALFSTVLGSAIVDAIGKQAQRTASASDPTAYPTQTSANWTSSLNKWKTGSAGGWTSGFFPGLLWQLHNITGQADYKTQAMRWTAGIENEQHNTGTHDVGFIVFDSFGKGLILGGMAAYKEVVLTAAKSLSTRFNPTVGCTQSWNAGHHCRLHPKVATNFPVIIDNMMNLELLLWAGANGGGDELTKMAVSHATKTMHNHLRPDGSAFHVVDYDPSTGEVAHRCTAQGYDDASAWSRGQAWAVNGFSMVYRYTGDATFLNASMLAADYFVKALPSDSVPLWDYGWPGETGAFYRDSTAGAIGASGLADLAMNIRKEFGPKGETLAKKYEDHARTIATSLITANYFGNFDKTEGILLHATGSFCSGNPAGCPQPDDNDDANEVGAHGSTDVSLVYGGFFLLEALTRLQMV